MVTRNSGTIDDVKKIIRSINIIGNKTSKIFLEEGTNLIPISKSIEKIIEELELINNEIMKNGYNEVLNVISNLETFISNNIFVEDSFFEDNLNKINSINYKITELDNSIKGFYKIVKSLNFVRVNIKIENARVTNGNIEFEDVAKVIERLCLVIKEKISARIAPAPWTNGVAGSATRRSPSHPWILRSSSGPHGCWSAVSLPSHCAPSTPSTSPPRTPWMSNPSAPPTSGSATRPPT